MLSLLPSYSTVFLVFVSFCLLLLLCSSSSSNDNDNYEDDDDDDDDDDKKIQLKKTSSISLQTWFLKFLKNKFSSYFFCRHSVCSKH